MYATGIFNLELKNYLAQIPSSWDRHATGNILSRLLLCVTTRKRAEKVAVTERPCCLHVFLGFLNASKSYLWLTLTRETSCLLKLGVNRTAKFP